jgi:RNA polymerase sigma-70 factor (ECF subfamily)
MLEDRFLVWRLRRGSPEALCTIYERYRDDLLRMAASVLNDTSMAEDLVHDVFLAFARGARGFQLTGSLKGYLATCVANRARNANRDRYRQHVVNLDEVEPVATDLHRPDQWIQCTEQFKAVCDALSGLTYEQREVVALHVYGKMTFREIAQAQAVSIKTVQSRYRYGLDKLRTLLERESRI